MQDARLRFSLCVRSRHFYKGITGIGLTWPLRVRLDSSRPEAYALYARRSTSQAKRDAGGLILAPRVAISPINPGMKSRGTQAFLPFPHRSPPESLHFYFRASARVTTFQSNFQLRPRELGDTDTIPSLPLLPLPLFAQTFRITFS